MSIYDLTYSKAGKQLTPPDKRNPRLVAFVTNLLVPMQWLRDLWLGDYRTGSTASAWTAGTYAKYARVIYNKVVYESIVNGNTDTPPSANWMQVQANFIGLSEREMYTGQCLTLTYALNKWFGTTFRQPNQKPITSVARASNVATLTVAAHGYSVNDYIAISGLATAGFNGVWKITGVTTNTFTFAITGANISTTADTGISQKLSDIYLLTQANSISIFRATAADANSSKIFTGGSTEYVFTTYDFSTLVNFSIYMPVAIWTALASNTTNRNSIVQNFVNQYLPAGLTYSITTY